MNNREKMDMVIGDSRNCLPLYIIYTIQYLEGVPEDMIPPEVKKMKTGCVAFLNSFLKTLDEEVDSQRGIIKRFSDYVFYPNGMAYRYDYLDLGLKPWTPSKKSQEEYNKLKSGAKTVAEIKAEESKKSAKNEAAKLKREKANKKGHVRLGDIKKLCVPVYWQLKKITSKNFKFPVNNGPSLATLVSQLEKCNSIIRDKDITEQKRKMMEKLSCKYSDVIDDSIKPYIGSSDNIYTQGYGIHVKDFGYAVEYEMHCSSTWFNVIPGKEKEFFNIFKNLAAKAYQHNQSHNRRYGKISQSDIMEMIMRNLMNPDSYGYNMSKDIGIYSDIVSAVQLLERSQYVDEAIKSNNPNQEGLTPFMHDFLIKANFVDAKEETAESEQK